MFTIGQLTLSNGLMLAPLSGLTNSPFRRIAKEHGCSLVWTEMVNASGLLQGGDRTLRLLKHTSQEKPLAVQLFGTDPALLAEAALAAEESGADLIDLNMGCPAKKVVRTGAGCALMRDLSLVRKIIRNVRHALSIPLTIKIRSGWDNHHLTFLEVGKIAQQEGVDAIIFHPRTRDQGFQSVANWSFIRKLKSTLSIPVIGNGDVRVWEDYWRIQSETGCEGVMIGRGALGNPWIFSQILASREGESPASPAAAEIFHMIKRHLQESINWFGAPIGVKLFRGHLAAYTRGFPHSTKVRREVLVLREPDHILEYLSEFFQRHYHLNPLHLKGATTHEREKAKIAY